MRTKKKRSKKAIQVRLRRRSLGAKDAQILALTQGPGAVKDALTAQKLGVVVARKAAEAIRSSNAALAAALEKAIDEFAPARTRGRSAPVVGEARHYRVQVIGEGEPFIRIPTGLLEAHKGAEVVVHFHKDQIVISRSSAF